MILIVISIFKPIITSLYYNNVASNRLITTTQGSINVEGYSPLFFSSPFLQRFTKVISLGGEARIIVNPLIWEYIFPYFNVRNSVSREFVYSDII